MGNRYVFYAAVALAFCGSFSLQAQWTQANGPWTGSYLSSVASCGSTLLAGTQDGVYRSTNGGNRWERTYSDTPMETVVSFAISESLYFAGTASNGVFRSTDDGRSWIAVNNGLAEGGIPDVGSYLQKEAPFWGDPYDGLTAYFIPALTFNPDKTALFAGNTEGVFRSTDSGASWTAMNIGLTSRDVRCFAFRSDGELFFTGTEGGLFKSTDQGQTWVQIGEGINQYIDGITYNGSTLIVGTKRGVYRSTDDGLTWTKSAAGFPSSNAYDILSNGSLLFASSPDGVYWSDDDGVSWKEGNDGFPVMSLFRVFHTGIGGDGATLYACTDYGIYRSDIYPIYWEPVNVGIPTKEITAVLAHDGSLYAATRGIGLHRSDKNGGDWYDVDSGLTTMAVNCLASFDSVLFAGTSGGVQRSINRGATWDTIRDGPSISGVQSIAVAQTETGRPVVLTGTGFGAFLSMDTGVTWSKCELPVTFTGVTAITVQPNEAGGAYIFAGLSDYGVCLSTDYGKSWTLVNNGLTDMRVLCLTSDSTYVYAGCKTGIFRTRTQGGSWAEINTGLPGTRPLTLASSPDGNGGTWLLAGMKDGVVYASTDNGLNWELANDGLPVSDILSLIFDGDVVYAGTENQAVWSVSYAELLSGGHSNVAMLNLHQNYPNPYNPAGGSLTTSVQYELPTASYVTIKVYNALGQEVGTIIDGLSDEGMHTAVFDGSSLPSGIYIYRLISGENVRERKMTVVR